MIPLSDGVPARHFPVVNVALIAINFAVWLLYELPDLDAATLHASFYPCAVDNGCHPPVAWGVGWISAMFLHASWEHILGNMLFLAIFGKNVEDNFGRIGYLIFYLAAGFVATMVQTALTLFFDTPANAQIPVLGASGAIAAVLGAYFVFYPFSRVLTLVLWFPVRIPAWLYLGAWFSYQFFASNYALHHAETGGSGVAFFAHVGGFVFGVVAALALHRRGGLSDAE